jgi:hypothetical protein
VVVIDDQADSVNAAGAGDGEAPRNQGANVQSRPAQAIPPWEGPYVVVKVLKPGTYKLANEDDEELTNAWNIQQLCRFYP